MKSNRILVLLLSAMLILGCMDNTNAENPQLETDFYEVARAEYTDNGLYTEKQIKIITSQSSYDETLLNYSSSAPDSIDFSVGKVLLVDMGGRTSGGYSIVVTSIDTSDEYVMANITLSQAGQGCTATSVLTNPYQFVFIRSLKEILIKENLTIVTCEE